MFGRAAHAKLPGSIYTTEKNAYAIAGLLPLQRNGLQVLFVAFITITEKNLPYLLQEIEKSSIVNIPPKGGFVL